jgi:hypothetical protein
MAFVAWWDATVTPGEKLGTKDPVAKPGQGPLPVVEATAQTYQQAASIPLAGSDNRGVYRKAWKWLTSFMRKVDA